MDYGRKIKRQLFRISSRTPYDRPPTAARGVRNSRSVNESGLNAWLPKFVKPVSSLISGMASRFFSVVCRKRLTEHPNASGSREKIFIKLKAPTINSVEQRLANGSSLKTPKDIGISKIEKQVIQRNIERAKVIHVKSSQSSNIHQVESENKPKKVLKRGRSFLDDDESLLCRPRKIHKKLVEKEKQVDNIPFSTTAMEDAIQTNDISDAFTYTRSSLPIKKSPYTAALCHTSLLLERESGLPMLVVEFIDIEDEAFQDEMVVENAPFATTISQDIIAINHRKDGSTNATISSHVSIPSRRKPSFRMSAPQFIDLEE